MFVDFGGEGMLSEVGWKERERGVGGVSAGGLQEREGVIEGAPGRSRRKERVENGVGLGDGRDEGGGAVLLSRAKAGAAHFDGQERLRDGGVGERQDGDALRRGSLDRM